MYKYIIIVRYLKKLFDKLFISNGNTHDHLSKQRVIKLAYFRIFEFPNFRISESTDIKTLFHILTLYACALLNHLSRWGT